VHLISHTREHPWFSWFLGEALLHDDWHRWTSDDGFEPGSGWHHVAVTYTFGKPESLRGWLYGETDELARLLVKDKDYRAQLLRLASELKVEFLDMHGPWGRYIRESGKELTWFKRDNIHANERGAQILGRILSRYLAPVPK